MKDWLRRALARALCRGLPSIDGKVLRKTVPEPGAVQAIVDDTDNEATGQVATPLPGD